MGEALLHVADAVLAVMEILHDPRRGRPLRALRRLGERDAPWCRVGRQHHERDRFAVGRPPRIGRLLSDPRDLRGSALGIHPSDEQLRPLGLPVGQIEDARTVRRPARVAALDEEPVVRAVGVHDPQRRLPFVFDLVHPAARVHDLGAVGRDLGIGHLLPVEVMVHGEQGVGGRFLGGRPRSRHRQEQQRET